VAPGQPRSGSAAGAGNLMNYHHVRVVKGNAQWLSPTSRDVLGIAFGLNKATPRARLLEEIGRARPPRLPSPAVPGRLVMPDAGCDGAESAPSTSCFETPSPRRAGGRVGAVPAHLSHGQAQHHAAAGLAGAVRRELKRRAAPSLCDPL
jgi:hypothetical protein